MGFQTLKLISLPACQPNSLFSGPAGEGFDGVDAGGAPGGDAAAEEVENEAEEECCAVELPVEEELQGHVHVACYASACKQHVREEKSEYEAEQETEKTAGEGDNEVFGDYTTYDAATGGAEGALDADFADTAIETALCHAAEVDGGYYKENYIYYHAECLAAAVGAAVAAAHSVDLALSEG